MVLCLEVKVGVNAAQFMDVIVAGEWWYLIREGKIFVENEAKVASWMGGVYIFCSFASCNLESNEEKFSFWGVKG